MNAPFAIRNVRLLEDGQVIPDGLIRVADGRIQYAGPERAAPRQERPGSLMARAGM
jgi:imidazolonepropionase-like amidohydrolase